MNSSIWLWFAGTLCMQIVPWTISGIKGLVENIPQQLPEAAPRRQDVARYLRDLFQNQVAILCIVPAGIAMMQQQRAYGLYPSLQWYWYLVAMVSGVLLLALGILVSKSTGSLMQRCIPAQYARDCRQYAITMQNLQHQHLWQRLVLGLVNGFSEEMLMRVFLMGFLIHFVQLSVSSAFAISVLLNGLHHTQQGRILGVVSVMVIQSFYAAAYLLWQDYLLIGLMHVGSDITGLVLVGLLQNRSSERE